MNLILPRGLQKKVEPEVKSISVEEIIDRVCEGEQKDKVMLGLVLSGMTKQGKRKYIEGLVRKYKVSQMLMMEMAHQALDAYDKFLKDLSDGVFKETAAKTEGQPSPAQTLEESGGVDNERSAD